MLEKIELFQMAKAMAAHAGTRQAIVSQNIANADTPGYQPRDITPFSDLVEKEAAQVAPRATRTGHLHGSASGAGLTIIEDGDGDRNPNENGVILEEEMLKAVAVKREHDRALAIYRSGLTILRASLGRS